MSRMGVPSKVSSGPTLIRVVPSMPLMIARWSPIGFGRTGERTANTPCSQGGLYVAFMRCCKRAGIQTRTHDGEGRLVEHVDIHSLRRTFATNAIVNGADPKSVQEVLGHRTLEMTMKIYAKVKGASKRQAVARLSYATGATPPDHVLPLAATGT